MHSVGKGCRAGGLGGGWEVGDWWILTSSVWRDCGKLPFFFCLCVSWALCAQPLTNDGPAALLICLAPIRAVAGSKCHTRLFYSQPKRTKKQPTPAQPHLLSGTGLEGSGGRAADTQAEWSAPARTGTDFIEVATAKHLPWSRRN